VFVLVEAGQNTAVEIPAGRSVVGKLDFGNVQSLTNVHLPIVSLRLKQEGPEFEFPGQDSSLSDAANFNIQKTNKERVLGYWLSKEGMARRRAERVFEIHTESDGTFRIDNVTPGVYQLQVNRMQWGGKQGPRIQREVVIPSSTDESSIDLGTLK
jgi:hypothetical protein